MNDKADGMKIIPIILYRLALEKTEYSVSGRKNVIDTEEIIMRIITMYTGIMLLAFNLLTFSIISAMFRLLVPIMR